MVHHPVLAGEVVSLLLPALQRGGVLVDATLGRAGHARRLLEAAPEAELVGLDRDPAALEAAGSLLAPFEGRIRLVRSNFADLTSVLERLGIPEVRGVLFDLGVSSPQLDEPERGFSFRASGPLDMRMDPAQPLSAEDVVNEYSAAELERVIRRYGEERFARRVTRAIVRARPVADTLTLAEIVKEAIPAATRRTGGHPAKRTFQAIRIEVNGELDSLQKGLSAAVDALAAEGRIAVLGYHSLEDRIVKRYFADEARGCTCPPDFPVCACGARARLKVVTRRSVVPSESEILDNPRARSARLRVAERMGEAA